jgi:hypothetical protein
VNVGVLFVKHGRNRQRGRPKRRWDNNIKMVLKCIVCVWAWTELIGFRVGISQDF